MIPQRLQSDLTWKSNQKQNRRKKNGSNGKSNPVNRNQSAPVNGQREVSRKECRYDQSDEQRTHKPVNVAGKHMADRETCKMTCIRSLASRTDEFGADSITEAVGR